MVMISDSAYVYYHARDYDAAIAEANKALELDPKWKFAQGALIAANEAKGEYARVLDIYKTWDETDPRLSEKDKQRALKIRVFKCINYDNLLV